MDRSRSKRKYYYDQDYDSRTKPRFNNNNRRGGINGGGGGGGVRLPPPPPLPPPSTVTTSYRILCHDLKAGGVIGKSGSIIKAIRQETGAWINVHQLIAGDEERIIEISDIQRRDRDGQLPTISPAQEALFMIHERIIDSDSVFGGFDGGEEEEDYGGRGSGGGGKIVTRLVVAKVNVGSLLGKGGKIIEQMRFETKTQIRVLPRDHKLPQCVGMSEEIVQVVGQSEGVKKAIAIISARLRESQLRDQNSFQGRPHSPEQFIPNDDFAPNMSTIPRRPEVPSLGLRPSSDLTNVRTNSFTSRSSGYTFESGVTSMGNHAQSFHVQNIVFRILCPNDKVEKVMGETDGIIELLRGDVGVDVRVTDLSPESDERIIFVSSDEGPDDDLFPAQEALLHIQSQIVDLGQDDDNIITTRLLVPSCEVKCLEGLDGSLSEMSRLTGANIQILPRELLASSTIRDAELLQIVGEIRAARDAIVEITLRLRSYLYGEGSFPNEMPTVSISAPDHPGGMSALKAGSPNRNLDTMYQNMYSGAPTWPSKDVGVSRSGSVDPRESDSHEDASSMLSRLSIPLVTRSTLEIVIPERAISKLVTGNKLSQISELSGASVTLVEDRPELAQKIIRISGAPDQAEKAQSLLQGFILSTQEEDAS